MDPLFLFKYTHEDEVDEKNPEAAVPTRDRFGKYRYGQMHAWF